MNATLTRALALLLALGLGGCTTLRHSSLVEDGPGLDFPQAEVAAFRANQDAVLRQLFVLAGAKIDAAAPPAALTALATGQAAAQPGGVPADVQLPTGLDWDTVIVAGMNYADLRCEAYIHALFRLNRDRKTVTTQLGLLGTASAGLMAAAESAAREVAAVAIAFGLASSTVDNLSSNLLYELEPSSVRTLVKSLQARYRGALPVGYKSRPAAMGVVRNYAALCLPASIESEVNLAVKSANPGASPGNEASGRAPVVSNSESVVASSAARYDDNTALLDAFVFPNGKLNDANRRALEQFLKGKNIQVDVASFSKLERYAAEREEAVRALGLKK